MPTLLKGLGRIRIGRVEEWKDGMAKGRNQVLKKKLGFNAKRGASKSLHEPKYSDAQDNEHRQIEQDGEAHSPTLIWTDLLTGEGESPKLPERVEIKREKGKEN